MDLGHPLLRALLLLFWTRRSNSYVAVDANEVEFRMGPLFRLRVPPDEIGEAQRRGWPWWLGWGARFDRRGTVGLIGGRSGTVQVPLTGPRWVWLVLFPVKCRAVAVTVEEPEALIAALTR